MLAATLAAAITAGHPPPATAEGYSLVGHTGGSVRSVAGADSTAWIGEGIGVTAIDVSDPESPRERWHLVLGPSADVWSVAHAPPHLIVGAADGVYVVDVDAEGRPYVANRLPTLRPVRAVTPFGLAGREGTWAFVVSPGENVRILDIGESGELSVAAEVGATDRASVPVAVDGSRALIATDELLVVDVADPNRPSVTGRTVTSGAVRGVAAREGIGFVSDTREGLVVLPLGAPTFRLGGLSSVGAGRLEPYGDLIYILEEHTIGPNTVRLVDVVDPTTPVDVLGGESTYYVMRGALDLAFIGHHAVSAMGGSMALTDVFDVHWPAPRSEHVSTWPVLDLDAAGACAYVAQGDAGLGVIDVRDAASPAVWASWRPSGGVYGVHVGRDYAYVSAANGFNRVDARDPCDPVPLEMPFASSWPATSWIDSDAGLLAATTTTQLRLARLSLDSAPAEIAVVDYARLVGWPPEAIAQGIAIGPNGSAYVAAGAGGTAVLSLADPVVPVLARMLPAPEGASVTAIALSGNRLAVGTAAGVLLYDASSPLLPRLVGAHSGTYEVRSIAFADDDRLHVAAGERGLLSLDVSDPTRPYQDGSWSPPFSVAAVDVEGDIVLAGAAGFVALEPPRRTTPTAGPTETSTPEPTPTSPGGTIRGTVYLPSCFGGAAPGT